MVVNVLGAAGGSCPPRFGKQVSFAKREAKQKPLGRGFIVSVVVVVSAKFNGLVDVKSSFEINELILFAAKKSGVL